MSDSKKIFELRKERKTDDAIKLGRELRQKDPNDLWIQKALAWSLYDKLKICETQNHRSEIILEIKSLPIYNEDNLIKDKVDKISSPFLDEIRKAGSISKDDGDHFKARLLLIKVLNEDPTEPEALLTLAWVEYRILSSESHQEKEKALEDLIRIFKQMKVLEESLFENVLKKASYHAADLQNYPEFIFNTVLTNPVFEKPKSFGELFGISEKDNFKSIVLRGLHKNLKEFSDNIPLHSERILNFVKEFDSKDIENNEWNKYYLGRLISRCGGDKNEALKYLLPYAREKKNEYWIWEALAEAQENIDEKIACLAKSIQSNATEDFIKKGVYEKLIKCLIDSNQLLYASKTIKKLEKIYSQKKKDLPNEIKSFQENDWFQSDKTSDDEYRKYLSSQSRKALEILFCDLPILPANFYRKNKDKEGNFYYYDFVLQNNSNCSFKTKVDQEFIIGEGFNVRIQKNLNGKDRIVWYEKRNSDLWDCIPYKSAVVIHKDGNNEFVLAAFSRDDKTILHKKDYPNSLDLKLGDMIKVLVIKVQNNKYKTVDYSEDNSNELPDFIKSIVGIYGESEGRDFGFIETDFGEEVYVPPHLAAALSDGGRYQGLALLEKKKNKKKYFDSYGWRLLKEPIEIHDLE